MKEGADEKAEKRTRYTYPPDEWRGGYDWWGQYGYCYAGAESGKSTSKSTTKSCSKKVRVLIDDQKFRENIDKAIENSLPKNKSVILVEPNAMVKMHHMIHSLDNLEIFGKLIIDVEEWCGRQYPVVKDLLIPYQEVEGAHFESPPDLMARWMFELQKNPDGSFRPVEEVNNITTRMLGHFHSHGVDGGTRPSATDTNDMIEHREKKPFWVEIIGNGKGFSGRITYEKPLTIMTEAEVVMKWWTGVEDTLKEMSGKINALKYEYSSKKKDTKKKDKKEKKKEKKNVSVIQIGDEETATLKPVKPIVPVNEPSAVDIEVYEWDPDDPVQVGDQIPPKIAQWISEAFTYILKPGYDEHIVVEVIGGIPINCIYDNYGFVCEVLDALEKRERTLYETYLDIAERLGFNETFTMKRNEEDGVYRPVKRTYPPEEKVEKKSVEEKIKKDVEERDWDDMTEEDWKKFYDDVWFVE